MEMTKIKKCDVNDCAYNMNTACHAMAITIGNAVHPKCDTFCLSTAKGGDYTCVPGVGACKVSSCLHNAALECRAAEISVGYMQDEPDCLTFRQR